MLFSKFTEINPDKGTETRPSWRCMDGPSDNQFTEINPDKGTETPEKVLNMEKFEGLQKLTPIRGRKLFKETRIVYSCNYIYKI